MDFSNLLDLLGPFREQVVQFYSIASVILSLIFILWVFNLVSTFIHRTYLLGKAFGHLYRNYIHRILKFPIKQIKTLFSSKSTLEGDLQL